jgi:hypothetical protein
MPNLQILSTNGILKQISKYPSHSADVIVLISFWIFFFHIFFITPKMPPFLKKDRRKKERVKNPKKIYIYIYIYIYNNFRSVSKHIFPVWVTSHNLLLFFFFFLFFFFSLNSKG